jgi:hypothetical protein
LDADEIGGHLGKPIEVIVPPNRATASKHSLGEPLGFGASH